VNASIWSLYYPSSAFAKTFQLIRLFEIVDTNIYSNADYFQTENKIEISTLVNNEFNKRTLNLMDASSASPIDSLIVTWNYPNLIVTINCVFTRRQEFTTLNELTVLSLPFYKASTIKTVGSSVQDPQASFVQAGCVNSDFFFPTESPKLEQQPQQQQQQQQKSLQLTTLSPATAVIDNAGNC
jgi:hypothetical protein